jgi:DNA-binding response OmpR family regulator
MNQKILVVDDDPGTVRALQIRLESAGYEVLTAVDGASGIRSAVEDKPDLAILDIRMPAGGGFSVAHLIRERAPEVRVVFITASKKPELRQMADEVGAVGFLDKPYEVEELLAVVANALTADPSPVGRPTISEPRGAHSASAAFPGESEPAARDAGRRSTAIAGTNKILIVEDDRKIAMALGLRLRAAGQEVIFAYDAAAGLSSAVKEQPDLVLLDIGLPAGSGLVVAERIRNLIPRYVPIIFLTASRQPELRRQALALGAAGFLEKPFEAAELMVAIQDALNRPGNPSIEPSQRAAG